MNTPATADILRVSTLLALTIFAVTACSASTEESGIAGKEEMEAVEGGHSDTAGETALPQGDQSGTYIVREATWNGVRRGVRLEMRMDDESGSFTGTVTNTTDARICAVRVEVHLADGPELGPTDQVDLAAGTTAPMTLDAEGQGFERWTAHSERSDCGG